MGINLTDYTEAWQCNETLSSQNLLGFKGVQDLGQSNAPGLVTGHVEDPDGDFSGRGPLSPLGGVTGSKWFIKTQAQGDIFDVRGKTSCTMAGWFKIKAGETGDPTMFAIHNPSAAAGQALLLQTRRAIGDFTEPGVVMLDGVSAFNAVPVEPGGDTVDILIDEWQFLAGGYDAVRNKVFGFWGRAVGESYYAEVDWINANGFGYDADNGDSGFGHFKGSAPNGGDSEFSIDQCMWWNGRALTQKEASFLWNNHAGRALTDLRELQTGYFVFYG